MTWQSAAAASSKLWRSIPSSGVRRFTLSERLQDLLGLSGSNGQTLGQDLTRRLLVAIDRWVNWDLSEDVAELEALVAGEPAPCFAPSIVFAHQQQTQFRRFSKLYRQIRAQVSRHLAALNDHAAEAFRGHPDPATIASRMQAMGGVAMSPESPNTRANRRAWAQWRIMTDGRDVYCDWHTKISPTVDRIHFHPGRAGVDEGPVMSHWSGSLGSRALSWSLVSGPCRPSGKRPGPQADEERPCW